MSVTSLLERLKEKEMSIADITKEYRKMKTLRDLQKAFVEETGVKGGSSGEVSRVCKCSSSRPVYRRKSHDNH